MGSVRSTETKKLINLQGSREEKKEHEHTIDFALISLITYSAHELRHALFSVQPNSNRLVVMTEQTSESGV